MHIILGILAVIFVVMLVLQVAWMGITWFWGVTVRGLHVPVAAVVASFFVFRVANLVFRGRLGIATLLSIAGGFYAAWWVVNRYYYYFRVYEGIRAEYLFGWTGPTMSAEASTYVAYFIGFLAALVTTFRGRSASLSPEQLEERRTRALSSAKGVWETLMLLSYGEYMAGGRRVDVIFVVLPLIGVIAFLIGVWQYFAS